MTADGELAGQRQAALVAASREIRASAQAARARAAATVAAAERTRARLGGASLPLRALAVRRLLARGGPDALLWVDRALRPAHAASETARSAAPTRRA